MRTPTTPRPPPVKPAACPTSSSSATPRPPLRHLRALAHLQRQGRRHRLLLGRSAVLPHRHAASRSTPPSTATAPSSSAPRPRASRSRSRRSSTARRDLSCPLLGLFGNEDQFPNPEQVDELERALEAAGKTYEFHRYDDAGHAFFTVDRPAYRPEAAVDGWQRIFDVLRPAPGGLTMCTYLTVNTEIAGSAKGAAGLVQRHVGQRLLRPSRSTRRSTTRSTSTSPTRPGVRAPGSPSS